MLHVCAAHPGHYVNLHSGRFWKNWTLVLFLSHILSPLGLVVDPGPRECRRSNPSNDCAQRHVGCRHGVQCRESVSWAPARIGFAAPGCTDSRQTAEGTWGNSFHSMINRDRPITCQSQWIRDEPIPSSKILKPIEFCGIFFSFFFTTCAPLTRAAPRFELGFPQPGGGHRPTHPAPRAAQVNSSEKEGSEGKILRAMKSSASPGPSKSPTVKHAHR